MLNLTKRKCQVLGQNAVENKERNEREIKDHR